MFERWTSFSRDWWYNGSLAFLSAAVCPREGLINSPACWIKSSRPLSPPTGEGECSVCCSLSSSESASSVWENVSRLSSSLFPTDRMSDRPVGSGAAAASNGLLLFFSLLFFSLLFFSLLFFSLLFSSLFFLSLLFSSLFFLSLLFSTLLISSLLFSFLFFFSASFFCFFSSSFLLCFSCFRPFSSLLYSSLSFLSLFADRSDSLSSYSS